MCSLHLPNNVLVHKADIDNNGTTARRQGQNPIAEKQNFDTSNQDISFHRSQKMMNTKAFFYYPQFDP